VLEKTYLFLLAEFSFLPLLELEVATSVHIHKKFHVKQLNQLKQLLFFSMNDMSYVNMTLDEVCGRSGKFKQAANPKSFGGRTGRIARQGRIINGTKALFGAWPIEQQNKLNYCQAPTFTNVELLF
jgi:hypothetical protein